MRRAWTVVGLLMAVSVGLNLFHTRGTGQPAGAAAVDATHKKITVTGTATVPVRPDTARVSFAVRASGNDFKAAVAECDKMGAEVEKAIKGLKLGGLEVKKGPINVVSLGADRFGMPGRPFPGGPGPGGPGVPMGGGGQPFPGGPGGGFVEVSRTFTVVATFGPNGAGEFKDIVPVSDKILAAGITAGAIEPPTFNVGNATGGQFGGFGGGIGGFGGNPGGGGNSRIEFHRANWTQIRQDGLKLAVDDAIANAKVAAGVAKLTAKDIVTITDQHQFGGLVGGFPSNTGRGEVLGEMELNVQVSVTFSY